MSAPTPWAPAWSLHSVKGGDTNLSTWATDRHTDTRGGALLEGGARVPGFGQTLLSPGCEASSPSLASHSGQETGPRTQTDLCL